MFIKTVLSLSAAVLCSAFCVDAYCQEPSDSLDVIRLQDVVVEAVRVSANAPFAVANLDSDQLKDFSTSGMELPLLFARTPGIIAWSENGVGTGTSYMRLRGAGGSRINVTLDGVPLNSPEDQTVFWANMNSYGALMGSVQIQRGVGSSTNGDGAFGGSVALGSKASSLIPMAEISSSYGSWNTLNWGASLSSGLLLNHLVLEAAYHQTSTDGFIHGTAGRSGSYYGAATWLGSSWKLSYKYLGNFEMTGQAWNGVTAGNDDLSLMDGTYGASTGIRTYADLCDAGLGRYNSLYEQLLIDGSDYKLSRYAMRDGSFWPRTTDNFWQNHHILNASSLLSENWKLSATAHYTAGYGYYEEFRLNNKLTKYGISNFTDSAGELVKRSDFVRRKGLSQNTFGVIVNTQYSNGPLQVNGGLSVQQFLGNHFGYLMYAGNAELQKALFAGSDRYKYYDSDASKFDASAFVKAEYSFAPGWNVFADLQYRHVRYISGGYNDKYYIGDDGIPRRHMLDIDASYDFFNPKAGINYSSGPHRAYASFAMSNREPERNNFTDNGKYPAPRAERLYDWEAGYQFDGGVWNAGAGLYYMRYRDQLVQTGELSDIGEALTTNVPGSYRVGVELVAGWKVTPWLTVEGNAALSRNRLLDFDEYVEDWDNGVRVMHYSDKALAYSPDAILNGFVDFHTGGFSAVWHTGYVSRMYLDNSENALRSLPAYSLSDLSLGYKWKFSRILKELELGVKASNLFSAKVAQSGWVYSAVCDSYGHPEDNRYYQIGFIPVAPLTVLGHVVVRF